MEEKAFGKTGGIVVKKHLSISKDAFDKAMSKILTAKPVPRKEIKSSGKYGSKAPIFAKP